MTPEWWREYRARNRDRLNAQQRARRAKGRKRGDRSAEYAKRRAKHRIDTEPLQPLFPDLTHGVRLSFWEDELRMDLRQERALAELEGRDPDEAARVYRTRENVWHEQTRPISEGM